MTTDLENSLPGRLRALRVDPPDDGFMGQLSARLEAEPATEHANNALPVRRGRRRGILLLSLAAIFVSGGAFAFLETSPLSWRSPDPPAAPAPAPSAMARTLNEPARRAHLPRPRLPEAMPAPAAEPVVQAPAAFRAPAVSSPLERTRPLSADARRSRHDLPLARTPRDPAGPELARLDTLPTLPSPVANAEEVSKDRERRDAPRLVVPRLDADLHRGDKERQRPERLARAGEEARQHLRRNADPERRRDVDRPHPNGKAERPEGREPREPARDKERERRRSE